MRQICCFVLTLAGIAAAPPVRVDEQQVLKAIVEKGVEVAGGADLLAKYPGATWKGKGTYHGAGAPLPFTLTGARQGPTQLALTVVSRGKDFAVTRTIVINGEQGWSKLNERTEEMPKEVLAEEKERLYAGWVATLAPLLKEMDFTLAALPPAKVGGKEAAGVKVSHKGQRDVLLYFDKASGLLRKREANVADRGKTIKEEVLFDDYRPAAGMKHARKVRVDRDGKLISETEITEYTPHEKLPEATFARP
jgi:hypothetical protein